MTDKPTLVLKPVDRAVKMGDPNPTTVASYFTDEDQDVAGTVFNGFEVVEGSFAEGDDFRSLDFDNARFSYEREVADSDEMGATTKIYGAGVYSRKYNIQYVPGTLTVVE